MLMKHVLLLALERKVRNRLFGIFKSAAKSIEELQVSFSVEWLDNLL